MPGRHYTCLWKRAFIASFHWQMCLYQPNYDKYVSNSIISNFKSNTTEDYFALGEALSEQTSTIIKKCSMKGEPHNQLHVVLVPMLDEISILKESKNKGASQKACW